MEFFDLMVGLACGFSFGCLFTAWWLLPDEMDRR